MGSDLLRHSFGIRLADKLKHQKAHMPVMCAIRLGHQLPCSKFSLPNFSRFEQSKIKFSLSLVPIRSSDWHHTIILLRNEWHLTFRCGFAGYMVMYGSSLGGSGLQIMQSFLYHIYRHTEFVQGMTFEDQNGPHILTTNYVYWFSLPRSLRTAAMLSKRIAVLQSKPTAALNDHSRTKRAPSCTIGDVARGL